MNSQPLAHWMVLDLTQNNVPPNASCIILIQNTSSDKAFYAGVRATGSSSDQKSIIPPRGSMRQMVKADSNSRIETYAEDNKYIKFILTGFML